MSDVPEPAIKGDGWSYLPWVLTYTCARAHTHTPLAYRGKELYFTANVLHYVPDFWKQKLGGVEIRVTTTNCNIPTKFVTKLQLPLSCSSRVKLRGKTQRIRGSHCAPPSNQSAVLSWGTNCLWEQPWVPLYGSCRHIQTLASRHPSYLRL